MIFSKTKRAMGTSFLALTLMASNNGYANTSLTGDELAYGFGTARVSVALKAPTATGPNIVEWAATLQANGFLPAKTTSSDQTPTVTAATLPADRKLTRINLQGVTGAEHDLSRTLRDVIHHVKGLEDFAAPSWMTAPEIADLIGVHGKTLKSLDLSECGIYDSDVGAQDSRVPSKSLTQILESCSVIETFCAPLTDGKRTQEDLRTWFEAAPTLTHVKAYFGTLDDREGFVRQKPTRTKDWQNVHKNLPKAVWRIKNAYGEKTHLRPTPIAFGSF